MAGGDVVSEAALLIHYMPLVVGAPWLSDWERSFCASIVAKARSGRFRPSARQLAVMRPLVARFRREAFGDAGPGRDDDAPVLL